MLFDLSLLNKHQELKRKLSVVLAEANLAVRQFQRVKGPGEAEHDADPEQPAAADQDHPGRYGAARE